MPIYDDRPYNKCLNCEEILTKKTLQNIEKVEKIMHTNQGKDLYDLDPCFKKMVDEFYELLKELEEVMKRK